MEVKDRQQVRLSVMIHSMGGVVKSALESGLDVIVTELDREVENSRVEYDKKVPLIRTAWLDALIGSQEFIDPMTFSVRQPRAVAARKPGGLQTPVAAVRQIKGLDPAEVLRKRDMTTEITKFLVARNEKRLVIESEKEDSEVVDLNDPWTGFGSRVFEQRNTELDDMF
jgi:hypothetical protein